MSQHPIIEDFVLQLLVLALVASVALASMPAIESVEMYSHEDR
jgi:hypothetical protein